MHKTLRQVLAENVAALMRSRPDLATDAQLRRRAKLGGGQIDGIRKGTKAATIDTIERVARAFGLEPYQLLVPGLDPDNPATVRLPANEKRFYERLQADIQRLQQNVTEYATEKKP